MRRHWFEPNGEGGVERLAGKALTTPAQRREAALKAMREPKISQRRVCNLVGVDPKTVRRERLADHADIRKQMHEIAGNRRRFGYPLAGNGLLANRERRRIGIMLEREGFTMNEKKLYRLYKEEGLSVRRRRGRKRARGTRRPMPVPNRPNVRWSLDFMSDTFGASRKFRILAVIDDCTRETLCLVADTSISGARVARELTALIRIYGKPDCIVSDRRGSENGPGDRFPEEGHRVHQHGDPQMGRRYRRGLALHRARPIVGKTIRKSFDPPDQMPFAHTRTVF